jgi:hypothetical protein
LTPDALAFAPEAGERNQFFDDGRCRFRELSRRPVPDVGMGKARETGRRYRGFGTIEYGC